MDAASRPITAWIVPLKGHPFDLEDLPLYLEHSRISVVRREEAYFLSIGADIVGQTFERVIPAAERYAALLNGLCAVALKGVQPFELDGGPFHGIDAQGNVVHTAVRIGPAGVRCKVGRVTPLVDSIAGREGKGGALTPLLQAAKASISKADALVIVGRSIPSWSELYLVFQLVESGVGRRMYRQRWISLSDAEHFTRTASSHTALHKRGSRRHKDTSGEPPADPMAHPVALHLMRRLVARWLDDETSSPA